MFVVGLSNISAVLCKPFLTFILKRLINYWFPLRRIPPSPKYAKIESFLLVLVWDKRCEFALSCLPEERCPNIVGWVIWSIGALMSKPLRCFFRGLCVVILSWVGPKTHTPSYARNELTDPLLRLARSFIPAWWYRSFSTRILIGLKLIEIYWQILYSGGDKIISVNYHICSQRRAMSFNLTFKKTFRLLFLNHYDTVRRNRFLLPAY